MTTESKTFFDPVDEAVDAIARGELVIVTDDEDRENEGDLIMAASKATPETINMMIRHGRGLICAPAYGFHLRQLGLNPMVPENRESQRTDFTVSVDAAKGISTGISAYDRAFTIRALANPAGGPEDFVQPGHVFPLRAKPGGVLERAGHTEASVDLASLAGLPPIGVLCEILTDDGSLARVPELIEFKKRFGLKMISIASLIEYRLRSDLLVERVLEQPFESEYGTFQLVLFTNKTDQRLHPALVMGEVSEEPTLVRVHRENLLGDLFRASGSKSHTSLEQAMRVIAKEGRGVFLFVGQPNSGLPRLLEASRSKRAKRGADAGDDMDLREYGIGAQILVALGLKKIRLLSSSHRHVVGLDGYGLEIVEEISLQEGERS